MIGAVQRVALCGGTHGNERTGVTVIERALLHPARYHRPSVQTTAILTNERAVRENRRYIDFDLNRCFGNAELATTGAETAAGYEHRRARELNALLGPKESNSPAFDLCIDLHTTTANMGPTIIIREEDPLARIIAAVVPLRLPAVRVLGYGAAGADTKTAAPEPTNAAVGGAPGSAGTAGDYPFLAEVTTYGVEIEVGPVAQGVVRQTAVRQSEQIIEAILDIVDAHNRGTLVVPTASIELYHFDRDVDYPRRADGSLFAMVHPRLQDRDFALLQPGDPLFLTFDDQVVRHQGNSVYPVFINEAAYYEKNCAMTFTRLVRLPV